jgi:hypothetical protein
VVESRVGGGLSVGSCEIQEVESHERRSACDIETRPLVSGGLTSHYRGRAGIFTGADSLRGRTLAVKCR